jgi:hypothetical protein
MSDRELLAEDGVQMDADTWLAFTLQFVTKQGKADFEGASGGYSA